MSMGDCGVTPVASPSSANDSTAELSRSSANAREPSYQCSVSLSRLTLCQRCASSSQVTRCSSDTLSLPAVSVTRQRYQIVAPGGSDPDFSISHVHDTSSDFPGSKSGKALAVTWPQVSFSTPYSSTTWSIVLLLSTRAWKVIRSGNSMSTPR